jgi:hypothetical protein
MRARSLDSNTFPFSCAFFPLIFLSSFGVRFYDFDLLFQLGSRILDVQHRIMLTLPRLL